MESDVVFEYIDKKEAAFLLSLLKNVDCSYCPDFHLGCESDYTYAQLSTLGIRDYLYKHKRGTESFLCGKLRNIIIAEDVKLIDLNDSFDLTLKTNIGYLEKNLDKCIVNTTTNNLKIKHIENSFNKELNKLMTEYNNRIVELQNIIIDYEKQLEDAQELLNLK